MTTILTKFAKLRQYCTIGGWQVLSMLCYLGNIYPVYAQDEFADSFLQTEESSHNFTLQISAGGTLNKSQRTWLEGGLGRFNLGKQGDGHHEVLSADVNLAYQYLNDELELFMHLTGRGNSEHQSGRSFGLVELYAQNTWFVHELTEVKLTLGQFFLPTSMENTREFWESPYMPTFSSINSWIGEEFRPIGLDVETMYVTQAQNQLGAGATLFGGNDALGAQLAWRGWTYGKRLSVLDETLPLPPLMGLADEGGFNKQDDEGSKPIGKDLDSRPGYALRAFYRQEDLNLQATWVDNRGDRHLHNGEYAWDTRFLLLGFHWQITQNLSVLGEWMKGDTAMGFGLLSSVDVGFTSAYLMSSYQHNDWRLSLRYDEFKNDDKDWVASDLNDDLGHSYSAGLVWHPDQGNWRFGVQWLYLISDRQRLTDTGLFDDSQYNRYQFSVFISKLIELP